MKTAFLALLASVSTAVAQVYQPPSLSSIDPVFRTGEQFNQYVSFSRGSLTSPPQVTLHYGGTAAFTRSAFSTANRGELQIPIPAPLVGSFRLEKIELADASGSTLYLRDGSIVRALYGAPNLPTTHSINLAVGDFATGGAAPVPPTNGPSSRLVNIATLGQVSPGNALTAGFVVRGSGLRVLIRAVGPTLAALGVPGALANPQLRITNATGLTVETNDDWGAASGDVTAFAKQMASVGAFAFSSTDSRDAAVVMFLQPGNYTAVVSASDGAATASASKTGTALVEVYELP